MFSYKQKYLKYKQKYFDLKGGEPTKLSDIKEGDYITLYTIDKDGHLQLYTNEIDINTGSAKILRIHKFRSIYALQYNDNGKTISVTSEDTLIGPTIVEEIIDLIRKLNKDPDFRYVHYISKSLENLPHLPTTGLGAAITAPPAPLSRPNVLDRVNNGDTIKRLLFNEKGLIEVQSYYQIETTLQDPQDPQSVIFNCRRYNDGILYTIPIEKKFVTFTDKESEILSKSVEQSEQKSTAIIQIIKKSEFFKYVAAAPSRVLENPSRGAATASGSTRQLTEPGLGAAVPSGILENPSRGAASELTQPAPPAHPVPEGHVRVYVMRHGDRADDEAAGKEVNGTVDRKEDTPLSPAGHATATRITNQIKTDLDGPINKIVSSPLLRCVQTAVAAQKALLPLMLSDPIIKLDVNLREVWHPLVLKRPISEVKLRSIKELGSDPWNIDTTILEPNSDLSKVFDKEERGIGGTADGRYREAVTKLAVESAKVGHKNLLIVTHGDCLGSFVPMVSPNRSVYQVDYCGVLCADYNPRTGTWVLKEDMCIGVGMM